MQPDDAGQVGGARFVAARVWWKTHRPLRNEIRRGNIVPAYQCGPQLFLCLATNVKDPDGQWSQQPFVCICCGKIHLLHRRPQRTKTLDAIETKEHAAFTKKPADLMHIESMAAQEM